MKSACVFLVSLICFSFFGLMADPEIVDNTKFSSFIGKVKANRVKLRLNSSIDGLIAKEMDRDDIVVVVDLRRVTQGQLKCDLFPLRFLLQIQQYLLDRLQLQ